MSMKVDSEGKSYDDINVTPMVDLYLVLLLIFIIMTTAGLQGLKVNLPKPSNATSVSKNKKVFSINVTGDGKILLNQVPVSLPELETRLKADCAQSPDSPVVVHGDGKSPYATVMDVINVCAKLNITSLAIDTKAQHG